MKIFEIKTIIFILLYDQTILKFPNQINLVLFVKYFFITNVH